MSFLSPNRAIFRFPILVSAIFEDLFGGDPDYRMIVAQKQSSFFHKRSVPFCVFFSKTKTNDILSGNHPFDAWEYPAGLCEWHAGTGRSAFVAQLQPSPV